MPCVHTSVCVCVMAAWSCVICRPWELQLVLTSRLILFHFCCCTGISHLDMFTNMLITQCEGNEALDKILPTLVSMTKPGRSGSSSSITVEEGKRYCRRFIRAVVRVYIVLQAQAQPEKVNSRSPVSAAEEKCRSKCRRVFMVSWSVHISSVA